MESLKVSRPWYQHKSVVTASPLVPLVAKLFWHLYNMVQNKIYQPMLKLLSHFLFGVL